MRIPFFFLLLLSTGLAYGQFTAEDTLRAEAYDEVMINNFASDPENKDDTYAQWIEKLGALLAERRLTGPVTVSLAYNYHRMSLLFKDIHPYLIRPYADTAIVLREAVGAPTADIAQSYYEKGMVLQRTGQAALSHFFHEEALKIMDRAIGEEGLTADLGRRKAYFLKEAAFTAKLNGNYELARLRLAQIPPLAEVATLSATTIIGSLITEASIELNSGNYDRADSLYAHAISLPAFAQRKPADRSRLLQNRAYNKMLAGDYPEAERLYTAARAELGAVPANNYAAYEAVNLLRLDLLRGRPGAALAALPAAEATVLESAGLRYGEVPGELYTYSAEAAALLGEHDRADSLFSRAAAALLEDPRPAGPALLPRINGNTIYSQPKLLDMLSIKRAAFRRRGALENALATARTIDTLLRYNREQLNLTASLGQHISREAEQYAAAIDLARELYRTTGNSAYRDEAYRFSSGQKSNLLRRYLSGPGLAESLGVPTAVVREKSDLELTLLTTERALLNATAEDRAALRDSLLRLNARADELKRQLAADYPAFSQALRGFPAVDPTAAAATLDDDQLIVEYFLSADTIYTFALSRARGLRMLTVARPADLNGRILDVVEGGAGATTLYDLLVSPVLSGEDGITRLQFIPDGALWRLPFGALKKDGRFLAEDYAVSFAYAAPLLFNPDIASRARAQTEKYLGYGISYEDLQRSLTDGTFRGENLEDLRNMGQLPFAVREIARAAGITGGRSRLDAEATLRRFNEEAAGANILHLSMHGLLRANPLESALVFRAEHGYGLLTMKDVLAGEYPAALTILSACHTGGGPLQTAEGMQSIGRAFTAAGSRATITSTWAARDEATHEIITETVGQLEAGLPADVALQRGIIKYLRNASPTERNPKNWANLTLTGSVQPVLPRGYGPWYLFVAAVLLGAVFFWWRRGVRS